MNRMTLRSLAVSFGLLLCAMAGAQGQFFTTEFESAGDLSNYNLYSSGAATGTPPTSPSAAGQFQHSGTAGRLGSGGIIHTAGGTTDLAAVYQPSVFDLTSPISLTISGFFRTPANPAAGSTGAVFQIGFSANNTTALYGESGNAFISARVNHATADQNAFNLQTQTKVSATGPTTATLAGGNFSLTADTWYKLLLTVAPSATPNVFNFSTALENWGTTGAQFVSTVAAPAAGTMTNSELYSDTTTYAAFRAVEARANSGLDSFSVIPEPSAVLLLAPAAAALLARRRQRAA